MDHGTLIDWISEAEDATEDSRTLSERCRDYYDSRQLTSAEVSQLKKRKQAPVVINRIKPKMDGLMGMEKSNRTTARAFARTPKHEKASEAATEATRFVLQDNFYNQIRSSAWENIIIEGTGGVEVVVKPKGNDFRITINHIPWDRQIIDPHCRSKHVTEQNARFCGQVMWMDYDDAIQQFPDGEEVLEVMFGSNSETYDDKPRWMDTVRRRVKVVELYYREQGDVWYSCFTRGGYLKEPQKSPYVNEEGETEWPYEFASAFVDRDGKRYGAVVQLLDIQDEINKRRSKALHLMSVRQVRWERGAVEDINKARQELAKPDGVIETTPGMEFEVLKTGDMAQAQFNLLAEAKQEIDAVGVNAALSGKETRQMSGRALFQREATGQTELAPMFDVLKHMDVRVYRKVWNRIRQYWKAEKWIRVTDDEQNLKWVGLNKPITKGELLLKQHMEQMGNQPMTPQMQQQMEQMKQQIQMDPMMQEVVSTENDIAQLDVDMTFQDAPDVASMQIEEFQVLGEMVKSGIPIPPKAIIEASPLPRKDRMLKLMEEGAQVPPQVQEQMKQMQEAAQKLAQENQQLKQQMMANQQKIQAEAQASQQKIQAEAQANQQELQAQMMIEQERIRSEEMLARMQAAIDASLERFKAELKADTDLQVAAIQASSQENRVAN